MYAWRQSRARLRAARLEEAQRKSGIVDAWTRERQSLFSMFSMVFSVPKGSTGIAEQMGNIDASTSTKMHRNPAEHENMLVLAALLLIAKAVARL